MARSTSLSGTPDDDALPSRLAGLHQRLDELENPDQGAATGGGFVIAPDADKDGVLNINTAQGQKWQIFPPQVHPEDIQALKDATTPTTSQCSIVQGSGTVYVTRVGIRCWLSGTINGLTPSAQDQTVATVPDGFLPKGQRAYAVATGDGGLVPTGRIVLRPDGSLVFTAKHQLVFKPDRQTVVSEDRNTTDKGGKHTHTIDRSGEHLHGCGQNDANHHHTQADNKQTQGVSNNHGHPINRIGSLHAHTVKEGGEHTHTVNVTVHSTEQFARNPTLTEDPNGYPSWVALDACSWDLVNT